MKIKGHKPPVTLFNWIWANYLFNKRLFSHLVSHISVVVETVRHGQRQVQIFGSLKQKTKFLRHIIQPHRAVDRPRQRLSDIKMGLTGTRQKRTGFIWLRTGTVSFAGQHIRWCFAVTTSNTDTTFCISIMTAPVTWIYVLVAREAAHPQYTTWHAVSWKT